MKTLKYIAGVALIAGSLSACSSNSAGNNSDNSKTLGGSTDTMNAVAGSNAGGVNKASSADTSDDGDTKSKQNPLNHQGNVDPTGRAGADTVNQGKNSRP